MAMGFRNILMTFMCTYHKLKIDLSFSIRKAISHLPPDSLVHIKNPCISQWHFMFVDSSSHQQLRVLLAVVEATG